MESDSESEQLRARFEALKVPSKPPVDGVVKTSPTATRFDRAAMESDFRSRLAQLSTDSGTEVDDEELERILQSEDEYLEEVFHPADPAKLTEVRHLLTQLQGSRPTSRQSRAPLRQDSTRTVTSVPLNYSADSDADDEGAADEFVSKIRDELALEGHSRSTSSNSSRDASGYERDEAEDSDSSESVKGNAAGQRTPPSKPRSLIADTEVGRYHALFSSLETPRALPVMTPTSEGEPLPPVFAKLQGISPHSGKIGDRGSEADGEDRKPDLGVAPKLDLEGWRAAKDDKPETWCSICNADATLKCPGCDNDLYCQKCYTEGHPKDAFDADEHKPIDYASPSTT